MIAIHVNSTILDRWQGTSHTFEVWGNEPSSRYIAPAIADAARRQKLINFFLARRIDSVIRSLVPTRMLKPSEVMFTKGELFNAVLNASSEDVAGQIVDLVTPGFLGLGILVGEIKTANHVRYGYEDVTVDAIRRDVSSQQIVKVVKTIKLSSISRDNKYSIGAFAEIVAEEYRRVGLALLEIDDIASVVSDIVTGVRASLDPSNETGTTSGIVPNEWANSKVVQEASKNLVFVRAALDLPRGSNLAPANDGYKLDKWASIILAALQSSERYAWVSKREVLRTYSMRKIRDNEGLPIEAVLSRAVCVQPVSQTVFALEDSVMDGAFSLSATSDRTGDVIQLAYGSSTFNVDNAGALYCSVESHLAESGFARTPGFTKHDLLEAATSYDSLALMIADRVYARARDDDGGSGETFELTYIVATRERPAAFLRYLGTEHRGDEIATRDIDAVFIATDEFEAVDVLPPQPQVYGPVAFNSKLVGFDVNTVMRSNSKTKFDFNTTINGVVVKGVLKPGSMLSMRALNQTSVVKPHFNAAVIDAYSRAVSAALDRIRAAEVAADPSDWNGPKPSNSLFTVLKKQIGRELLQCARALSPAFRDEVRRAVVDRAVATAHSAAALSYDEERVLRARLTQQAYVAYCDLLALEFFLFVQGIECEGIRDVIGDPAVIHSYLDVSAERS